MGVDISGLKVRRIGTMVINVSEDDNASSLLLAKAYHEAESIVIMGTTVALVGAVTLAGLRDEGGDETADASFVPVNPAAVIITDGSLKITDGLPYPAVRLESAGIEVADHSFPVFGFFPAHTNPQ